MKSKKTMPRQKIVKPASEKSLSIGKESRKYLSTKPFQPKKSCN